MTAPAQRPSAASAAINSEAVEGLRRRFDESDSPGIEQRSAPPEPDEESLVGYVPGPVQEALALLGGLMELSGDVLWKAIRRPKGYWRQTLDEMWHIVRICIIPMFFAVATFDVMTSILGLNFLTLVGANNRYSEFFEYFSIREFSNWIMAIVVAGIVGSALCADLGARKVREELDALRVLGTDPVRELVLPRVLATTFITPLMSVVSIVIAMAVPALSTQIIGRVPGTDFYNNVFGNVNYLLVVGAVVEAGLFGFMIGIVCAYKGMNCGSGPIGVGRAVNQAVVLVFVMIFVVDFVFMTALTGIFPQLQQLH